MLQTCEAIISQFQGVPDLACIMLHKIMKLIKVCIKAVPQKDCCHRSMDSIPGRAQGIMLGFADSADTRVHHGVLRQGPVPAVPLHGHLGGGILYKIL